MSIKTYQKSHIFRILTQYDSEIKSKFPSFLHNVVPFDLFLKTYFKKTELDISDKNLIKNYSYNLLRFSHSIDTFLEIPTWESRFELLKDFNPEKSKKL